MSLLEKASLVITPNAYKESKLYSVIPNTTLGDMTVVRATTATRVNEQGLIEVVPYNFLPQSSNIGSWYSQNVTITTGILDENGGNTAITMNNISSGNNTDFTAKFSNPMTLQTNNVVNYSAYLKGTGTIGIQIERGVGGDYFVNNNIITLTNDWVRYNYSFTIPFGVNAQGFHLYITNLTGTTATSVDICFPQVSYGGIKEYFPTTDRLNIPRIDYSNGSCPSILVEPQRTNLVFPSATLTTQTRTVTAVPNTLSFYGTGAIVLSGVHSATLTGTGVNNRVSLTFTPTAGSLILTVTGTVTNAQLEVGSYATSYIPTTSAAVTRNADVISKTGISSLLGTATGSAFVEFTGRGGDIYGFIPISLGVGVSNLAYLYVETNNRISAEFYQSGVLQAAIATGVSYYNSNNVYKAAFAWANNDFVLYINGTQIGTDLSGTAPTPTSIRIGNYNDPSYEGPNINSAILFPTRLTNSELAQLTTI